MPKPATRRIALYALVVFASSALLLVLEVVAGRLIAPYVGVSLYTWTAVIGVVLAGLSVGNALGGIWADRGAGEHAAGVVLLLGAIASVAIPPLLGWVAPWVQVSRWSLMGASLTLVALLFFVPALLLGIVTPLLTTLALRLSSRTGHVVGLMHALAALGSIIGTFATGYWLVQAFGSRAVVLGTGAVLALLALPLLRGRAAPWLVGGGTAALLLLGLGHYRGALDDPCDRESSYFCIRVVTERWADPPGELRSLVLDHLLHGSNHEGRPELLVAPYLHLIDELVADHFNGRARLDYFFVGGGAYTQPRAVAAGDPGARITVAELDPVVTAVARERLFLAPEQMRIVHQDARALLAREPEHRYDVIVGDAFHDIAVPYHLVTREFAELVKARLRPDGLYVLNLVDLFPDPRLVKSLVKTLNQVFENVHIWIERIPQAGVRTTYVVSAADGAAPPELISARRGLARRWLRITDELMQTGTAPNALPLLTDDRAPVEWLIADLFLTASGR